MSRESIIALARVWRISGAHLLNADTAQYINGIGASWFPAWLRRAVTALHPVLSVASAPHDVRYELGGSCWDRLLADLEWLTNSWKCAWKAYPAWRLSFWLVGFQGTWFFVLLRIGGAAAFNYHKKG